VFLFGAKCMRLCDDNWESLNVECDNEFDPCFRISRILEMFRCGEGRDLIHETMVMHSRIVRFSCYNTTFQNYQVCEKGKKDQGKL
jgi:hypothetical protein